MIGQNLSHGLNHYQTEEVESSGNSIIDQELTLKPLITVKNSSLFLPQSDKLCSDLAFDRYTIKGLQTSNKSIVNHAVTVL